MLPEHNLITFAYGYHALRGKKGTDEIRARTRAALGSRMTFLLQPLGNKHFKQ
jgi:hypothetical protein